MIGSRQKTKNDFEVKYIKGVTGALLMVARKQARTETHYFEYSIDGKKTWVPLPPTTGASIRATGLPRGTLLWARHRAVTPKGYTPWSVELSIIVP